MQNSYLSFGNGFDYTRNAYVIAVMKRTWCTFEEAQKQVQATKARILANKSKQ